MNTGMLWFNNDPNMPLSKKITQAADYYRKKYGYMPNLALVNPSMLDKNTMPELSWIELPDGIPSDEMPNAVLITEHKLIIRPYRPVLPGHIWVGISDKE